MQTLISIKNITKTYSTKTGLVHALNGVSLDIFKGEIFGLLGVNGAGKTTLSSILATLHPATSGQIHFKDQSIYQDITAYRKSLGFCPQTQNLDQELTVLENLIFDGRYYLMPEQEIHKRAQELITRLELEKYKNFEIKTLSGGTKQRVLIARALMHNPEVIILDEPTVGLDPDIRRKLWGIIKDLKSMGMTIILTTHYLDEAEVLSDRICILHKGKVSLIASIQELKEKHKMEKFEDIFLKITKETHSE